MITAETLESRVLFAVTASAFHNTLYVQGDSFSNAVSVEKSGTNLIVKQRTGGAYVEFFRVADSAVSSIRIYGYAGADTLTVADNVTDDVTIYGGGDNDYLKGGGGMSHIWGHGDWAGNPDHDPATDDGANDILVSGKGYTIHYGQKGNDQFFTDNNAVSGYDVMNGGEGNDQFYITGRGNAAYAVGEGGADSFRPSQSAAQVGVFMGGDGWDSVDYSSWTAAVYVRPENSSYSGLRYGARTNALRDDVEFVTGTSYADHFSGGETNNTFYGKGGDDLMYGNGGDDLLVGDDGNDQIYGGTGDDYLVGSAGNDTIYGDAGNDQMYGNTGQDEMHGGDGNDQMFGQENSDWLYGDAGNDLLVGGAGADYLHSHDGVFGNDVVYGDNQDGTGGGGGSLDVAYIDRTTIFFSTYRDLTSGVESITA
jgi:Ca2+-binding RTX toxin-like protein